MGLVKLAASSEYENQGLNVHFGRCSHLEAGDVSQTVLTPTKRYMCIAKKKNKKWKMTHVSLKNGAH